MLRLLWVYVGQMLKALMGACRALTTLMGVCRAGHLLTTMGAFSFEHTCTQKSL